MILHGCILTATLYFFRNLLVKSVSPVLRSMRDPPDNIEHYKTEFGSLGAPLHGGVEKARKQSGNKPSGGSGSGRSSYSQHGPLSAPRAPQPQKVCQLKTSL